jgi:hypothetical protein
LLRLSVIAKRQIALEPKLGAAFQKKGRPDIAGFEGSIRVMSQ